jgi:predicted nucleotide-binding protein
MAGKKSTSTKPAQPDKKRTNLSQADVPGCSLEEALRVPSAIGEHYAYKPTTPLNVAAGMDMQPNAGRFRLLAGAALAYGLTKGGPFAPEISIEPLGLRIVRPTREGDDLLAKREALLKPRVVGEFLRKYNGSPLPRPDIARNILIEMGVPIERAQNVYELIVESARSVSLLKEIKGKQYIDLAAVPSSPAPASDDDAEEEEEQADDTLAPATPPAETFPSPSSATSGVDSPNRRVFITHGKNKAFVEPIKKLLGFGEMEPVVAVDSTSVSQPVPDKVMNDMRSCGAAIIHVDAEQRLMDSEANEHIVLNPNVLMEIGAAMALYGRRFILLVKDGVRLPSNLQGLFEVRYSGETLDGNATIRLLEAINDIKNHKLPTR